MLRVAAAAALLAIVTAALLPLQWVALRLRLPLRRALPVAYHRFLCRLIGLRLRTIGRCSADAPLMIVANHSSWADIPIIASQLPVVFVAKSEVADWPFFGLLARLQRSVFVERTRRHRTRAATEAMAARLAEGDPVVLFAEGTSSDGNRVLPFRSSLIGAAERLLEEAAHTDRVHVQPLALAYTHLDGLPLARGQRPRIAWYGDFDLLPHLAGVLRSGAVDAVLAWGDPVVFERGTDRKALAAAMEREVRRLFVGALRGG